MVRIGPSVLVLRVALPFTVLVSVWVWFSVRVGFPVWVLSVLVLVLSVRVWSSFSRRVCFLPLILRVFAVLIVVVHLNYPLVHYISDDT